MKLVEVLIVVALVGLVASLGVGSAQKLLNRSGARATAKYVDEILVNYRYLAIHSGKYHAIQWRTRQGKVEWRAIRDENGNGVRKGEMARGVDKIISRWKELPTGFLQPGTGRLTKGPMGRNVGHSGSIHFGRSSLCSASPKGDTTPGSLYLYHRNVVWCLRTSGAKGRTRLWS